MTQPPGALVVRMGPGRGIRFGWSGLRRTGRRQAGRHDRSGGNAGGSDRVGRTPQLNQPDRLRARADLDELAPRRDESREMRTQEIAAGWKLVEGVLADRIGDGERDGGARRGDHHARERHTTVVAHEAGERSNRGAGGDRFGARRHGGLEAAHQWLSGRHVRRRQHRQRRREQPVEPVHILSVAQVRDPQGAETSGRDDSERRRASDRLP